MEKYWHWLVLAALVLFQTAKGGTARRSPGDNEPVTEGLKGIAWGNWVKEGFLAKVTYVADYLGVDPSWLMTNMRMESAFDETATNPRSGAYGLIQWTRTGASSIGKTLSDLKQMDAMAQLDQVAAYFRPYKGRMKSMKDVRIATFFPAALGESDSYVLFSASGYTDNPKHSAAKSIRNYKANRGSDKEGKGYVTKGDVTNKSMIFLKRGYKKGNVST